MDSLLANYASSDDEAEEEKEPKSSAPSKPTSISTGLPPPKSASLSIPPPKPSFSSLPPPKSSTTSSSSSIFSSLPPPKSHQPNPSFDPPTSSLPKTHNQNNEDESNESKERKPIKDFPSSSIFSALPPPKSQPPNPKKAPPLDPNPKRVVQFTLPLNPSMLKSHDPDEEEDEERKPIKDFSNLTSSKALSSMLPAPKNSLCLAPTAASRRSTVDSEAKIPTSNPEGFKREQERDNFENYAAYPLEQGVSGFENYGSHDGNWVMNGSSDPGFGNSYESDGGGYGSQVVNWADGSVSMAALEVPDVRRIVGKRGRNEIPAEIVEVKQDELIKNRPREDQVKLTGIAFGPAYQPVSSSKGKPSKLHKRKHQIGSLYHDMKQKEMELAERRSKGLLTKAETQAKYGW